MLGSVTNLPPSTSTETNWGWNRERAKDEKNVPNEIIFNNKDSREME